MLNQIFNPENLVFRWAGKLFDLVVLSLCWLLFSLPLVTAGSAAAALYYSVVKCVRRGEDRPIWNFFHSFKENLGPSIPVTLLALVVGACLFFGQQVLVQAVNQQGGVMGAVYVAYLVALVAPAGLLCYLFPLLSRFSLRTGALLSTAFKLALGHLPSTVVLVALLVSVAELCLQSLLISPLPLLLCPGMVALLSSLLLERSFREITPREETDQAGEDDGEEKPWYLR